MGEPDKIEEDPVLSSNDSADILELRPPENAG